MNVDVACAKWNEIFLNLVRQYISNKVIKIRIDNKPWYNSDCGNYLVKRTKYTAKLNERIAWVIGIVSEGSEISILKRYVKLPVHTKPTLAFKLNEGIKTNPKSWWHIARQFIGKTKCSNIPAMQCGDAILVENCEKAENFNNALFNFFATIYKHFNVSLPDIAYKTDSRLSSVNITQAETLDILKSLDTSKASGPDGISCKMLKGNCWLYHPVFYKTSTAVFVYCYCYRVAGNKRMYYLYLRLVTGQILEITDPFYFLIFVQSL